MLIECRMARELEKRGLTSFAQYMEQMRKDRTGEMAGEMVNRLTTNYTYFMREPAHFLSCITRYCRNCLKTGRWVFAAFGMRDVPPGRRSTP